MPGAERIFARKVTQGRDCVVHFVPLKDSYDDVIFVQLPFVLTAEETAFIKKTTNLAGATIPMRNQQNENFITSKTLAGIKELMEPLIRTFRCLVYEEEYQNEAEQEKEKMVKALRIHGENDDRVDLKLLAALNNPTSNLLHEWYPIINLYCLLLLKFSNRIAYSYTHIISLQEFCRYYEICLHTISLMQTICHTANITSWNDFNVQLDKVKDPLLQFKSTTVEQFLLLFFEVLNNSTERSLLSLEPISQESWGSIKWKAVNDEVFHLLHGTSHEQIFVFIPTDNLEALQMSQKLSSVLDIIRNSNAKNKEVFVCSEQVLKFDSIVDNYFPLSMSSVISHFSPKQEDKISFAKNDSSFYLKTSGKQDVFQYAEELNNGNGSFKKMEKVEEALKLFCKNQIPFCSILFNSQQFIHTDLMKTLLAAVMKELKNFKKFKKIIVGHYPCMGGTTTARYLAFSIQSMFPVLLLRESFNYDRKFQRIVDEICSHANLLIIADNLSQLDQLENCLRSKRVVLVVFQRVDKQHNAEFFLSHLHNDEIVQFKDLYERVTANSIVEEKEAEFLYLGLVYLHEEYRRNFSNYLERVLHKVSDELIVVLLLLSLAKSFAKKGSLLPIIILQKVSNCNTAESLLSYFKHKLFSEKVWLLQFLRENNGDIEVGHKGFADVVITVSGTEKVRDTMSILINNVCSLSFSQQQVVIDMICHERHDKSSRFSKLVDYLKESARDIFTHSLNLQNVYCHIHFCKWLMQFSNDVDAAKSVIEKANKILNQDTEILSTMYCSHGDTFRRIYKQTTDKLDAENSIQYYLRATSRNNSNFYAEFGLSKIILELLESSDYHLSSVSKYLSFDPMKYLVNLFIKAKFMGKRNAPHINSFVRRMKQLLSCKKFEQYSEFLNCNSKLNLEDRDKFELIRKWNHLIDLHSDPERYLQSTIQNDEEKSLAAYIYMIANLVNFLNGKVHETSVCYAKARMEEQSALYPLTYFYFFDGRYHFSKPSLLFEDDVTIPVFPITKEFSSVKFVEVNWKNRSVMKLYIDGDKIECETL